MLKSRRGSNLVSVSVDNEIHKDATVIKVLRMPMKGKWSTDNLMRSMDQLSNTVVSFAFMQLSGRSRPGLLTDVSAVLDEMIGKVCSAGVWIHKGGVACVIHVKCHFNVEFAKMGCLWERLFPILQGHDNKQVVERVGAQEFPLMHRNELVDYSLPSSSSDFPCVHIHMEKTERGNGSLIAHVKGAHVPLSVSQAKLISCWSDLDDVGYGIHKARIYYPGRKKILFDRTSESYEDIDLNGEGVNKDIIREALEPLFAEAVRSMQISITGDKMGLTVDLLESFRRYDLSIFRADMSDAHEITLYVGDEWWGAKSLGHLLLHPILKYHDLCISYPEINLFTHPMSGKKSSVHGEMFRRPMYREMWW